MKNKIASILSLFGSGATLVCCALPALFVLLGAGAVFAGLVSSIPQITWLSAYKEWVFAFAGLMLLVSGFLELGRGSNTCPPDSGLADACKATKRGSFWIWVVSCVIYLIGGLVAFVLPAVFF